MRFTVFTKIYANSSLAAYMLAVLFNLQNVQAQGVLDTYIKEAWQSSDAIRIKQVDVNKAILSLGEAQTYFTPVVTFGGNYTLAAGGRKLDFPIGDLLNPVYGTLNQLTQTNNFPRVENQNIQLLPNNFYDVRFRVQQPVYQPGIKKVNAIINETTGIYESDIKIYKRELAHDVQVAYAQYMQTGEGIAVLDKALTLLAEAKRVSESLYKNGVGLPSAVTRVDAEIATVQSERDRMVTLQTNAAAYFNFLLNRPFETAILADSSWTNLPPDPVLALDAQWEEIFQLKSARNIAELQLDIQNLKRKPTVGAQLDIGSQAFNFGWGGYVLFGLSFDMPVWNNGRNNYNVLKARYDIESLTMQETQATRQLQIRQFAATNSYSLAKRQYAAYATRIASMQTLYRDVNRRYKEGQANYIELLDAATQISRLETEQSLKRLEAWQSYADWVRATASYPMN
jgi:outer membrane protein